MHFSAFIKSNLPDKYPNLQIRYVQGRDPTIKLIDGSGEVKEVNFNVIFSELTSTCNLLGVLEQLTMFENIIVH